MKYIVIVPDGMFDEPLDALGGKTPLETANRTNMAYMAQHGTTGLVQIIPPGMPPGSDIGNMAILGYDPRESHSGRAPIEAANQGIHLEKDEIAVRCNFVTCTDNKLMDYSAGHIKTDEARILIELLNRKIDFPDVKFYCGKSYRHTVVIKMLNPKDCYKIKTFPPHDILGKNIKNYLPSGPKSEIFLRLMERSREILAEENINKVRIDLGENPADMVWLWGQGVKPDLKSFKSKFGLEGAIISAVDLVNGLGRLAGLEIIDVPGITGYYDTNFLGKAEYALKALEEKDFVYIHIEAPDEAGHNGDYKEKIRAIENVDKKIVGPILNHFNEQDDIRILLLPDHPTPVALRTHTSDPVGYIMYGKNIAPDGSEDYSEEATKKKGVRFTSGEALMESFITKHT